MEHSKNSSKKGKKRKPQNTVKRKIFSWLVIGSWGTFILGIGLFSLYLYLVSINFNNWFGPMPGLQVLENPKSEEASELYTEDGVLLGKYFRENRTPVEYDEISPNVLNALTATEDYRFKEHAGIDLTGLMRVFFKTILLQQRSAGGGSTISQQLAKNLFNTRSESFQGTLGRDNSKLSLLFDKTKEWITAARIEKSYTKKEIITMYLNTVDFGSNSFGIQVAAKTFFNTTPDSLSIPQAATLVGLLKATYSYSPVYNPENSLSRRNTVIDQLAKYDYLSQDSAEALKAQPLALEYNVSDHNEGLAPYFREMVKKQLTLWAKNRGLDLYADGLRIYTTLDSRMQAHAEEAVAEHMSFLQEKFYEHWNGRTPWRDEDGKEIKNFIRRAATRTDRFRSSISSYDNDTAAALKAFEEPVQMKIFSWAGEIDTVMTPYDSLRYYKHFLRSGFMAMDPHSGHIKAWVGGNSHKFFKYDHVKQGKRQPGSTFKPLVYATAMSMDYTPCDQVLDAPVTFSVPTEDDPNGTWTPKNSEGKYSGELYTLRKAMSNSVNSITAHLIDKVTPAKVVEMARSLGIKSHLEAVPALALGVFDLSVYELVGAYSTFVNQGEYTKPFYITRIEDKYGNVLQEFVPERTQAMDKNTAYSMVYMLRGATEESGGTAMGLHRYNLLNSGNEIGAKTGTTQNNSDGWFMGVTPKLVAGGWVGGEDRSIHFTTMEYGQGARMAMPIWANFMEKVYDDESLNIKKEPFPKPESYNTELECEDYLSGDSDSDEEGEDVDEGQQQFQNSAPEDFF